MIREQDPDRASGRQEKWQELAGAWWRRIRGQKAGISHRVNGLEPEGNVK